MVQLTYVEHDGTEHRVDVPAGRSVMDGAQYHALPGIVAECGGACACATCHVYFDDAGYARVGAPAQLEEGMLDVVLERRPTSRLSCQIKVAEALDGLVVRMPESQG